MHPENLPQALETGVALYDEEGASYCSVVRIRHAHGHFLWCEVVGGSLLHMEVTGIVHTLREFSDRRALEEQLLHQAFHDELTGLPNRRRFLEELEHSVERSQGVGLAS